MQNLVKAPARIKKFVPHSGGNSPDLKPARVGRAIPVLKPEGFDQLAHDARNALSALKLYGDLLAEPGVLTSSHSHYAQELQAVTDIAVRLVERLAAPRRVGSRRSAPVSALNSLPGEPGVDIARTKISDQAYPWEQGGMDDPGRELLTMRPLLAAIAGPRIELEIESLPCAGRSGLSSEDLTRVHDEPGAQRSRSDARGWEAAHHGAVRRRTQLCRRGAGSGCAPAQRGDHCGGQWARDSRGPARRGLRRRLHDAGIGPGMARRAASWAWPEHRSRIDRGGRRQGERLLVVSRSAH